MCQTIPLRNKGHFSNSTLLLSGCWQETKVRYEKSYLLLHNSVRWFGKKLDGWFRESYKKNKLRAV